MGSCRLVAASLGGGSVPLRLQLSCLIDVGHRSHGFRGYVDGDPRVGVERAIGGDEQRLRLGAERTGGVGVRSRLGRQPVVRLIQQHGRTG